MNPKNQAKMEAHTKTNKESTRAARGEHPALKRQSHDNKKNGAFSARIKELLEKGLEELNSADKGAYSIKTLSSPERRRIHRSGS